MSDTSQGPDWWQESDGKWYPPQSPVQAPRLPPPEVVAAKKSVRKWGIIVPIAIAVIASVITGS
jgi:hypothetical protein